MLGMFWRRRWFPADIVHSLKVDMLKQRSICPVCGFLAPVVTRPDGTQRLVDHKKRGATKCVGVDL